MSTDVTYTPSSASVRVGERVAWIFPDLTEGGDWRFHHSVTADNGSFDSCPRGGGATFTVKFNRAGTYTYHSCPWQDRPIPCKTRPVMRGEVKVG